MPSSHSGHGTSAEHRREAPTGATTEVSTTCPVWCQGGHGRDDWGTHVATGLRFRSHQGPSFGPHISVGAEQTPQGFEAPTAFVFDLDGAELDAPALRELAREVAAAAEWCEAHGRTSHPAATSVPLPTSS